MTASGRFACGTYSRMWKIAASKRRIDGSSTSKTCSFGVEKSMWPRQIQCARRSGNESIIATGCGSWMIT